MIETVASGIVYKNPKPYLRAIHAWHPSLVRLEDGTLVSTFDLGQAVESLDYRTYLSRSTDDGRTWTPPVPLMDDSVKRRSTHSVRIGAVSDNLLVGFGGRYYRDDPEEGLVNRENLGYVPMDLIFVRSDDGGRTWEGPDTIQPPLVGPAFELCHRIIELQDGRWLAPTSLWKGWHGDAPHGMKSVALVSHDQGATWPEHLDLVNQYSLGIISWEVGLAQLSDDRLVAVVWSFDERSGRSLPNRYALSSDGQTFSPARENGLRGETAKLLALADGSVLCLYRRLDQPGLWAVRVRIAGDDWINVEQTPIWQGPVSGMLGERSSSDELSALKFGYPSSVQLPDGSVFVVFWCAQDGLHIIRWQRLKVL